MKGFSFYVSYYDVAQELSQKDREKFYNAIIEYMFSDADLEQNLPKNAKIAFKAVKANLKRSKAKGKAGKSGMANRWQSTSENANGDAYQADNSGITEANQTDNSGITSLSLSLSSSLRSNDRSRSGGFRSARLSDSFKCPKCGGRVSKNTGTGKMECATCFEVYVPKEAASG